MADPDPMTLPTPPPYAIAPRPPGRWIDTATGQPTTEFYRFIVNLFQTAGSGQAPVNLAALTALVDQIIVNVTGLTTEFNELNGYVLTSGISPIDQIENILQETISLAMTARSPAATISFLQRRIADIETLILTQRTGATSSLAGLGSLAFQNSNSVSITGGNIVSSAVSGTTTNDNAPAGFIGEETESTVPIGSPVSLATGIASDITSILVSAGDWDAQADIWFTRNASTSVTQRFGWVSSTSATVPTPPGGGIVGRVTAALVGETAEGFSTGTLRFSLAVPTTIYMSAMSIFTVSTNAVYGVLRLRRPR